MGIVGGAGGGYRKGNGVGIIEGTRSGYRRGNRGWVL